MTLRRPEPEPVSEVERQEPDYGNWIRLRRLAALAGLAVAAAGATVVLWSRASTGAYVAAVFGLAVAALAVYLWYLHHQFSSRGGGLQHRLWTGTLDGLTWDGRGTALDVGTGNGALAIMLAERYPHCKVIGVDTWAPGWGYSQTACEHNAARRGVADRVTFTTASAAALPFDDGELDAVVSHFAFHEVQDTEDATTIVAEALRVLRPSGAFSFQDMFNDPRIYEPTALDIAVRELTDSDTAVTPVRLIASLPPLTGNRRTLGTAARLSGKKHPTSHEPLGTADR